MEGGHKAPAHNGDSVHSEVAAGTRLVLSLGPSFPPFSGAGTTGGRPRIRTTMSSPCLWGRVLQASTFGAQGTHSLRQPEGHLEQVLGLRLCLKSEGDSGGRGAPPHT